MDWSKYPFFIQAIRYWWKGARLDQVAPPIGRPIQDYLSTYVKNESQLAALDKTLRTINQDKIKSAMESLAKKYPVIQPPISEIVAAVASEAGKISASDLGNVGREVVTDTANAFKFGLPLVAGLAVVAFVFLYGKEVSKLIGGARKRSQTA